MPEREAPDWTEQAMKEWDRIAPGEEEEDADELSDHLFDLGKRLMEAQRG